MSRSAAMLVALALWVIVASAALHAARRLLR
jgi:hypothetical protein